MIDNWNAVVGPKDEVWHLGDFAWKIANYKRFLDRLNGSIHLVLGNHEPKLSRLKDVGFASIHDVHYMRRNGQKIFLSHYAHRTWRCDHYGSWHLYGHSHGHLPGIGRSMDVGVDACDYRPISFEEIHELFKDLPPKHYQFT